MTLTCSTCGCPFAKVENGCLVIESRHHGEKHTNSIALDFLEQFLREQKLATLPRVPETDWPEFCSQT